MSDLETFANLFASDESQTFLIGEPDDDGKRKPTEHSGNLGKPTLELFEAHLAGTRALEIVPRLVGCIDADPSTPKDFDAVAWCASNADSIKDAQLVPTFSKSGGVRLWRIMGERVSPKLITGDLEYWSAKLVRDGLKDVEVFPRGDSKLMLPCFGEMCGVIPSGNFLALAKNHTRLEDDLFDGARTSNGLDIDLKNNRHNSLTSLGGTMLANGVAIEMVESTITAMFEGEQANRPGDDADELRALLSWLRKKSRGGDDGEFSDLVRHLPHIQTKQSDVSFSMSYDGTRFEIDGARNFRNYNSICDAVMEQCGRIPSITRATWRTIRDELWQNKRDEIDHDSVESSIEFALMALITRSLHALYEPPWNGARLAIDSAGAYVDLDAGKIWYAPAPMLSRLNSTGLGFKCTSHRLMAIVRAMGGGAESHRIKNFDIAWKGTDKQKITTERPSSPIYMHWLPCPPDALELMRVDVKEHAIGAMSELMPGQIASDTDRVLTVGGGDSGTAIGKATDIGGDDARKILSDNATSKREASEPY